MKDNNLQEDKEYLSDICKGLEDLRQGNKSDIRQSQIEAFSASNTVLSDLNKYLFYATTLLIPLIFSIVGIESFKNKLTQGDIALIKASLVFLFFSLIVGFCHMISDVIYYRKWQKNTERQLKLWSTTSFWPGVPIGSKIEDYINEYESIRSRTDDIASEMESQSTIIFILMQGIFWMSGAVLITLIGFALFT